MKNISPQFLTRIGFMAFQIRFGPLVNPFTVVIHHNANLCPLQKNMVKWVMILRNGPSKICGRQPLKNLK